MGATTLVNEQVIAVIKIDSHEFSRQAESLATSYLLTYLPKHYKHEALSLRL